MPAHLSDFACHHLRSLFALFGPLKLCQELCLLGLFFVTKKSVDQDGETRPTRTAKGRLPVYRWQVCHQRLSPGVCGYLLPGTASRLDFFVMRLLPSTERCPAPGAPTVTTVSSHLLTGEGSSEGEAACRYRKTLSLRRATSSNPEALNHSDGLHGHCPQSSSVIY